MQILDIDNVDTGDKRYCISYPLEDALLLSSVERFGLLMPITLLSAGHPVVVTGFKRIEAARRLGIREIPCLFLDVDERHALLAAIVDNAGRSLNTIEKIMCVERMGAHGFPKDEIYGILKMIGLPAREKTIETSIAARSAPDGMKMFIVRHRLPITALEQLLWFDHDEQDQIVSAISPLDVTVSSLREILQLMMLLKVRSGQIDFGHFSGVEDMGTLKQRLKQMSHPLLSGLESTHARLLKSCALPPHVKVHVDPVFEKDWIDVSIRVRDTDEMDHALKKLERLLAEGLLGSLFDLAHGSSTGN
jgi:hypothetical protein